MFERLFKKEEPKVDVKVEKFSHERLVGWYQPVVARILQEDFNISRNLANHISNGLVDDAITNFETNDIINYMDWFVDKELGLFKAGLEKRETNKEEFIMKSLHNT
ncbi:MAG TPA: hypothetical protein VFD33_04550, partial [Bacillota bacterium]|nr:hypothetical protein [Bacillota bacterium]